MRPSIKLILVVLYQDAKVMYLDPVKKTEIFEKYGKSNTDTGSPESQIALF
ncbi:hypothetical protein EZS27_036374, partial [termite gut metagenome]